MKRLIALASVLAAVAAADAVTLEVSGAAEPWEDLAVSAVNRLPPRTYSVPLADERSALADEIDPETPYRMSLNGRWRISWSGDPAARVRGFEDPSFDDSGWFEIDVPSCVEMRGFGSPGYTNVRYPHKLAWPRILDRQSGRPDYNPVTSYRTRFAIPADWSGRRVILRFDGVGSAYYVWVNGHNVGYAEDSKLPSEFDITEYLREQGTGNGENVLAVEVYRWCDGSYLEDQDMFRFSGIFRDVTLWSMPKDGIWDFTVRTTPVGGYERWKVEVEGLGLEGATLSLYDADKKKVCDLDPTPSHQIYTSMLAARAWSAEKPYLYTLVIRKGDDIRTRRVGFKDQRIDGSVFRVNGRAVKFCGVNRHETSPENGRTVSLSEMVRDITLMKRYNVNAVRTSHYPDHRLWYDLCDRYGIYVIAEANVEGHEAGFGDGALGRSPQWDGPIVERNRRHVEFYRNHPSVTMWSLGNETGSGVCFRHAAAAVREADPTRPVHFESGNDIADVDSSMYPTVDWLEQRGRLGDGVVDSIGRRSNPDEKAANHTKGKAFFLCEYAHAMGNAVGNLQEYWDVFHRHDSLCGGCIWDWIDQAVWKSTENGRRVLAYGGDFDEEPNDGPFCCNGLIGPTREVTAKLKEVGHVYRRLEVTDDLKLVNRHLFTFADEFAGRWEVVADGQAVDSGELDMPHLAPGATCDLPTDAIRRAASRATGEVFLNVSFALRSDRPWAEKGWIVSRNQVRLGGGWDFDGRSRAFRAGCPRVTEDASGLTVDCGGTHAVFSRATGTLSELAMRGRVIVKDSRPDAGEGPRFNCVRAFTDNDIWLRDDFYRSGLTQTRFHARPILVDNGVVKTVVEVTGSKSAGFVHESEWRFADDGTVALDSTVEPHGAMPPALPRIGLSLALADDLDCVEWYGRGPWENYVDRCSGSPLGIWRETVDGLAEPYVRPQDNGSRGDVRWISFCDAEGRGVRFSASRPLFIQALRHGWEALEFARHRRGQQRFRAPVEADGRIHANLDVCQLGLGGASCGPKPLDKYVFPVRRERWRLLISPAGGY